MYISFYSPISLVMLTSSRERKVSSINVLIFLYLAEMDLINEGEWPETYGYTSLGPSSGSYEEAER